MVSSRILTRRTSFSCRSKTCVTKLRCVRNHCRAIILAMPFSCSAIYPIWFPFASIITYLFACSKPLFIENIPRQRKILSRCLLKNVQLTSSHSSTPAAFVRPVPNYSVFPSRDAFPLILHVDLPVCERGLGGYSAKDHSS